MFSPDKPKIKNAVIECFLLTKQKQLDFGDFNFLLNINQIKRYPTKNKKKLYKKWEKELKTIWKWHHPLKIYDFKTSYLSKILKELIEEGILTKSNGSYILTEIGYNNAIRSKETTNINFFKPVTISNFGNLTLYGFFPSEHPEMKKISRNFNKIEKSLLFLNLNQLRYFLFVTLHEIKSGKYKKKDENLALLFLKQRLSDPDNDDFKLFDVKGKPIIKYNNYRLDDRLSQLLINTEGAIVNFFDPKPVVFTPELTEKDIIDYHYTINDFVKNLS